MEIKSSLLKKLYKRTQDLEVLHQALWDMLCESYTKPVIEAYNELMQMKRTVL